MGVNDAQASSSGVSQGVVEARIRAVVGKSNWSFKLELPSGMVTSMHVTKDKPQDNNSLSTNFTVSLSATHLNSLSPFVGTRYTLALIYKWRGPSLALICALAQGLLYASVSSNYFKCLL
jgi:hypothetical protein